ncbi:hypothetical protein TTRE_0000421201 [Trichuris trichiura]|uniref:Uncharacterized protein n=1 Tax=Trichuris trichiura TaxID=36087 RepID=A0A077Z8H3_TRITR|nr:hypothetical protein TTRE_0000421201 [Trichuris trichiura]
MHLFTAEEYEDQERLGASMLLEFRTVCKNALHNRSYVLKRLNSPNRNTNLTDETDNSSFFDKTDVDSFLLNFNPLFTSSRYSLLEGLDCDDLQ